MDWRTQNERCLLVRKYKEFFLPEEEGRGRIKIQTNIKVWRKDLDNLKKPNGFDHLNKRF